ncbi:MAG: RtcB family protein, partial [Chloroflexota bacterium]|nr:RtcB family protein [Chloroflexota bacterium]
ALLPDAHQGYGLPIGGVLATENSVIPYAVGVDIACRMRLSVYPIDPAVLDRDRPRFRQALLGHTYFGPGVSNPERPSHAVLDDAAWKETRFLRGLQSIATRQLGTSGSGNHFVEFGELEVTRGNLGVIPGRYLALLSHSGSRRVGHQIATQYSKVAMERHKNLDREASHLAWLPLDSEEGQEYWIGMELAGRFASANHWVIHPAVAAALGLEEVVAVENYHNFAWKEIHQGREVIVHRKGATPAGAGVLGVIPGSMADPGYVVRGKGLASSLHSASHGAGRIMSRTAAFKSISAESRNAYLQDRGVELLSGGLDEAPQAYKRIEQVIALQEDLIDILGTFRPRLVRMAQEADDI